MDQIDALERAVQVFRARTGRLPDSWADLARAGILRGIPADPRRRPLRARSAHRQGDAWPRLIAAQSAAGAGCTQPDNRGTGSPA